MRVLIIPALYAALCAVVAPVSAFRAESLGVLPSVDTCAYVDVRVFSLFRVSKDAYGSLDGRVCVIGLVRPHWKGRYPGLSLRLYCSP
jgi:hypothetical protein